MSIEFHHDVETHAPYFYDVYQNGRRVGYIKRLSNRKFATNYNPEFMDRTGGECAMFHTINAARQWFKQFETE